MSNFQWPSVLLSIVTSVTLVLGFQNCSKSRFTSLEGAVLQTETLPADSIVRDEGNDGQTVAPGDIPPYLEPPIDDVSIAPPTDDTKGNSNNDDSPSSPGAPSSAGGNGPNDSEQSAGLVECQMLHPNKKIVLKYELETQHTNSSSVRVCMSQNACLSLINAHSVANNCSLVPGESIAENSEQAQCTEIFPGSKGTCKNASILSDEQVSELLKKMSGQI